MRADDFLLQLERQKLVVVLRCDNEKTVMESVRACYRGGIKIIEITFTVPNADKIISDLKAEFSGTDMILGAGTVLNVATAKIAIENGAEFIVSPDLDEILQGYCIKQNMAYIPGIFTPTEYSNAVKLGAKAVKLFPANIATPKAIKSIKGPFPNAKIMPTGGVNYENLPDWFNVGAIAVGASSIVKGAKTGDFQQVEQDAIKWVNKISKIKGGAQL